MIPIKLRKFQPRYPYKMYSYIKKSVMINLFSPARLCVVKHLYTKCTKQPWPYLLAYDNENGERQWSVKSIFSVREKL